MKRILHSAIDKVFHWDNLCRASEHVVRNKGAAGVDGMDVEAWQAQAHAHLGRLRHRLMNDTYRSKPVRRHYLDKPGSSKRRPLGIPVIVDRVCQQATCQVLGPVFEDYFHEDSHGFRVRRSTHTAARRVEALRRAGYREVVDLDIEGFFDHVDYEILLRLVRTVVKDRRVLGLIRGWLTAGVMEEGKVRYATSGTPQGGVISPLLSNVYLTVLDNALSEHGYQFVRYADDVVILCRTRAEAEAALAFTRAVLRGLKLSLNEAKTHVTSFGEGFDFLGFHFGRRHRGVGSKSLCGFYRKVRSLSRRRHGDVPVSAVIEALNPVLRGWGLYHRHGRNVTLFRRLDSWVGMRLRSYVHKHWRNTMPRPTTAELRHLGLFSLTSILRPSPLQLPLF